MLGLIKSSQVWNQIKHTEKIPKHHKLLSLIFDMAQPALRLLIALSKVWLKKDNSKYLLEWGREGGTGKSSSTADLSCQPKYIGYIHRCKYKNKAETSQVKAWLLTMPILRNNLLKYSIRQFLGGRRRSVSTFLQLEIRPWMGPM